MDYPKKHHYVPRFLLNNFTNEDGKFFFFDKRARREVLASSPEKTFFTKNLYSIREKSGDIDTNPEQQLSEIEHAAAHVVRKILISARRNTTPKLNEKERNDWNKFFYTQHKRTQEAEIVQSNLEKSEEILDQHIFVFQQTVRQLTNQEKQELRDRYTRDRIKKNAFAYSATKLGNEALDLLNKMGIMIARIVPPNKSFVIGSNPMVRFCDDEKSDLESSSTQIWLPLSYDIAISPTLGPSSNERLVLLKEHNQIRKLNEAIFNQSNLIAGRSCSLLKSLAGL